MPNRRQFMQGVSALPFARRVKRDYFKELGVRPFLNAAGTYTTLTASLMLPEVMDAINYASRVFVPLNDLQDAAGKRIAALIGCEAAMVTAGAASALTLGTAACMTGGNQQFIRRLPDTTGMKNEVIMQKSHRYGYDHAVRNCGVRIVEVETREELERAAGPRTALMLFFNAAAPHGTIQAAEFAALGKKLNVPTFNDAAADVPPAENLSAYIKMGFDLVTFSGGKGIRGPQSAGLLFGRADLIAAARLNASPYSDSIGRGMKVNKEEILGMMVAVESYVKRDHAAEWKEWERRVKIVADSVAAVRTVKTERFVPEIANAVPHLRITWDEPALGVTAAEAIRRLREGEPAIELRPGAKHCLEVAVWMLQPGEAQVVGRRIRQVLGK
ncbi:MAG: aminotransferase class V-fold PLP-dependent enzyme [Bryobacteraceae bacterium]